MMILQSTPKARSPRHTCMALFPRFRVRPLYWDTTFSGRLQPFQKCGVRGKATVSDPAGCTACVGLRACRTALASHPSVLAVSIFYDCMSNMYEVSGVDSSTALWGAVVFAEDSLGKSLPSASELFSLCPQPIPSDPTPQYVLQGLVRWRQRGSLVRAAQVYQSRL